MRPARCRWRAAAQVGVHHDEGNAAHWSGLERCASIWACPVCSAVIRAERASEIQRAADTWTGAADGPGAGAPAARQREDADDDGPAIAIGQGATLMVTLTLRHRLQDPLALGLDIAIRGWQRLQQQRAWRSLKASLGVAGYVRSIEVTWTPQNGWHPHVHALLFAERDLSPADVDTLQASLFATWSTVVARSGGRSLSPEHGVRVTRGAAAYLAKVQEHDRAGYELARLDLKASRIEGGLMPFELLDVDGDDRPRAQRLWAEYVSATAGRRAITWSRGLRERLALEEELTDDEVIDSTERAALRLLIPADAYDAHLRNDPDAACAVLVLVEDGEMDLAAVLAGGSPVPPDPAPARSSP